MNAIRPIERGATLVELVVALAIFAVLLLAAAVVQSEFIRYDRRMQIEWMTHPDVTAVVTRVRTDVIDSQFYPVSFLSWGQSPTTLLLRLPAESEPLTVVWDFSDPTAVARRTFLGTRPEEEWIARSLPQFEVEGVPVGSDFGVRIRAIDTKGELVVDRLFIPRV